MMVPRGPARSSIEASVHLDQAQLNVPERRRYLARDPGAILIAAAYATVVFGFAWYRHATYRSLTGDLAYLDQGVWLLAHLHVPDVSLIGGRNIFADHFSPVLVLFALLYAIASTPLWLFAGAAVALGFGMLALGPLLEELTVPNPWRAAFIAAYAASPLLWNAALFDWHPTTLAVPFLIVGITAALRDDAKTMVLMSLATILMRDDLGLAVVGLVLIGITRSTHRPLRGMVALLAIGWVVIVGQFGQSVASPQLWQAHYGYLGTNAVDAFHHPLRTVGRITEQLWSGGNLATALGWLIPLGLLPLLSPGRMLCGFLWVSVLFASARWANGNLLAYHYGALLLPFLLLAAGTAVPRVRHRLFRFAGPPVIVAFAISSLVAVNPFYSWIWRVHAPRPSVAAAALANIGTTDRVTATWTLTAHLSHRVDLLPFPYPFMQADYRVGLDRKGIQVGPELVAKIDAIAIYLPEDLSSLRTRQAFLRLPELRQFRLVFDREGLLVYRRPGPSG